MCIFRCHGDEFDPDAFIADSNMIPYSISRKGEPRLESQPDGERLDISSLQFDVSKAEWENLPAQVEDAVKFLKENYDELHRLSQYPGIELELLDFPYYHKIDHKTAFTQTDYLTPSLVELAGELNIAVELSLNPNNNLGG